MIYTVLTVPLDRRAEAADPKIWAEWRRAWWAYLKAEHGAAFAVQRSDPAGKCDEANRTGEPCSCDHCSKWHPHMNWLWVQRPGFRPFIPEDRLKAAWARIIGVQGGVVLWTNYSTGGRRLGHWYWYMGRTWAEWVGSVRAHLGVVWYGTYPKRGPRLKGCDRCGGEHWFWQAGSEIEADDLLTKAPPDLRDWIEHEEIQRCLRFEKT